MKIETALDLKKFLESLSEEELKSPLYFDAEARKFSYHYAKVGYCSSNIDPDHKSIIVLNEA